MGAAGWWVNLIVAYMYNEPVFLFVNLLRSLKIDSQPGGPVRQPFLWYRPGRLHRLVE